MDNRRIDVVSRGKEAITLALKLIWPNALGGKATHYVINKYIKDIQYYQNTEGKTIGYSIRMVNDPKGIPTLILLWSQGSLSEKLPYPHDFDASLAFIEGWLKEVDYGKEPDHDGDNGKGFRIFTEEWGHVAGHQFAIVGVQPAWAMYGK